MDLDEKVFRIYEIFNQRVFNEDRLISERINILLLSSSILFAGFVMLGDTFMLIRILVPCVGLLLSFMMWKIASASILELRMWLGCCLTIEEEEDAFKDLLEKELAVHSTWNKWEEGESRFIERLPKLKKWQKWMFFGRFRAWNMYKYFIPGIFFVIWTVSLILILI